MLSAESCQSARLVEWPIEKMFVNSGAGADHESMLLGDLANFRTQRVNALRHPYDCCTSSASIVCWDRHPLYLNASNLNVTGGDHLR